MSGCYDCGLDYGGDSWIEAVIPDKVWNDIRPEGCAEGCGLLCITCISRRLTEKGYKEEVPVWLCGTEPLKAMPGDPGDSLEILRNWTWGGAVKREFKEWFYCEHCGPLVNCISYYDGNTEWCPACVYAGDLISEGQLDIDIAESDWGIE